MHSTKDYDAVMQLAYYVIILWGNITIYYHHRRRRSGCRGCDRIS